MLASVELDTEWERFSRKKSGQISSTADIYIEQHSACWTTHLISTSFYLYFHIFQNWIMLKDKKDASFSRKMSKQDWTLQYLGIVVNFALHLTLQCGIGLGWPSLWENKSRMRARTQNHKRKIWCTKAQKENFVWQYVGWRMYPAKLTKSGD